MSTSGRRAVDVDADAGPVAVRSVEPLASRREPRAPKPSSDAMNASFMPRSRSSTSLSVVSTGVDIVRWRRATPLERADSDSSWIVDVRVWLVSGGGTGDSDPSRLLESGLRASISCTNAVMSSSSVLLLRYAGGYVA